MPTRKINAFNADNTQESTTCAYRDVTECPLCHYALEPKPLGAYYVAAERSHVHSALSVLEFCPRCRSVFVACYRSDDSMRTSSTADFGEPILCAPARAAIKKIPDGVRGISPDFAETYTQAHVAEATGLSSICGVGYRKALEFLVKDYLCSKAPQDAEQIKKEFLGASIKRIQDHRLKVLAERGTWIGNDEAHYVKKHTDLDLEQMKRFIRAMLNYIESELAFSAAEEILPR